MNEVVTQEELMNFKQCVSDWIQDIRREQQNLYAGMTRLSEEHNEVLRSIARMHVTSAELHLELVKMKLKQLGGDEIGNIRKPG